MSDNEKPSLETLRCVRLIPDELYQSCVYFLLFKEKIVYVGSSTIGVQRFYSHLKDKAFDTILMYPCPPEHILELEMEAILKYDPKYNVSLPIAGRFRSLSGFKKQLKEEGRPINLVVLRRFMRENEIKPKWRDFYELKDFQPLIDRIYK